MTFEGAYSIAHRRNAYFTASPSRRLPLV